MFGKIENLKLIASHKGIAKDVVSTKERKVHALFFRISGERIYNFNDGTSFNMKAGDVSFAPKGSSYHSVKISAEPTEYLAFYFDADISDPSPTVYSLENFSEKDYVVNHFCEMWNFGNESDRCKCYSLFYSLLSHILNLENQKYDEKRKFSRIEPGIKYMKDNIFSASLKAGDLSKICNISDTYFRKIFFAKFGMTPQDYILSKRLGHANTTIESGNVTSIAELARSLGFSDPLYFSRAYKKKYGVAPSKH